MTELVAAIVPTAWLPRFIGHRAWSRPEGSGAPADFYEVLQCWEEEMPDSRPGQWFRRRMLIQHKHGKAIALVPDKMMIQDVPSAECDPPDFSYRWEPNWDWQPPDYSPPEWPIHPPGWRPPLKTDTFDISPADDGGALFTL